MAPIEGRGCVAVLDHRADQLVLHTASQMPHIVRTGLAECLGLEEGRVRIVSPDVGGGFGYKGILLPRKSASAGSRFAAAMPFAGSRTGAST